MNLTTAALLISVLILGFVCLPFWIKPIREHAKLALAFGAIALLGTCFFDLIPELVEMAGLQSLAIMGASCLLFVSIHYLTHWFSSRKQDSFSLTNSHLHHHHHPHQKGLGVLFSMTLHCFSSGLLLVCSYQLSPRLAFHVFMGLLIHKAFEALAVSAFLLQIHTSKRATFIQAFIYAFSFPLGVGAANLFNQFFVDFPQKTVEWIAVLITSIAIGNLLGCLFYDFLIPAIREYKAFVFRFFSGRDPTSVSE